VRKKFLPAVVTLCPAIDSPERLAAIIDFTFNLGVGRLKGSTLRRKVNAGDWEAVPAELRKWTRGGGVVLRGLVIRREAEIALI
jgi:lysozyme